MDRFVEITFDCLPLRSVGRLDIPLDASPKFRARCERIQQAISAHGLHNTYFLYNARCRFHLTNDPSVGLVEFSFEGTLHTDAADQRAASADLQVQLERENCEWLTEPAVHWLSESVSQAVLVEFNHFIAAGDLEKTLERIALVQAQSDQSGGFLGMYL
jgi:hypothetical protein